MAPPPRGDDSRMLTAAAPTEELYHVETKTIAVDFGRSDIYSRIEEGLAGLEVGVLGKRRRHVHGWCWCTC